MPEFGKEAVDDAHAAALLAKRGGFEARANLREPRRRRRHDRLQLRLHHYAQAHVSVACSICRGFSTCNGV